MSNRLVNNGWGPLKKGGEDGASRVVEAKPCDVRSQQPRESFGYSAGGGVRLQRGGRRPADATGWWVRSGELFDPSDHDPAVALVIESGSLLVEIVTLGGVELCLGALTAGDQVVSLGVVESPAFAICYRARGATRIAERVATEADQLMAVQSWQRLLRTAVHLVHEISCLPTSHRLYCELLRLEAHRRLRSEDSVALPTQAVLALQLCTSRETISRELSFLRKAGVVSTGKEVRITNPGFLLAKLASALQLANENEVWTSIGAPLAPETGLSRV